MAVTRPFILIIKMLSWLLSLKTVTEFESTAQENTIQYCLNEVCMILKKVCKNFLLYQYNFPVQAKFTQIPSCL